MDKFDIVIPLGKNDISVIDKQLNYTIKNVIGFRYIYIIINSCMMSNELLITNIKKHILKTKTKIMIVKEDLYPFNINTVSSFHGESKRNGWYLQQLLKLYAGRVIPNILPRYLVIDTDTFILKPMSFMEGNICKYNYGTTYHEPYFVHMNKLHPSLKGMIQDMSGICHHMMFETKYINKLFDMIEKYHNDKFYNVFLDKVVEYQLSGASEYEIYFNYMILKHPTKIIIRKLNWADVITLDNIDDYDYVSYHWYRRSNTNQTLIKH